MNICLFSFFTSGKSFLLSLLIVISLFGCSSVTEPIVNKPSPGRRDYVWSVDTVMSPGSLLIRIWGSSYSDIYVNNNGRAWHYDGLEWKALYEIRPQSIFGFGQNDVWVAGEGDFWHFDGSSWSFFGTFNYPPAIRLTVNKLWGSNPNNIYLIGASREENYKPILIHFDGKTWSFIPTFDERCGFYDMGSAPSINTDFVFAGWSNHTAGDTAKLYYYDHHSYKLLYSGQEQPEISSIDGNVYVNIGRKIFIIQNKGLALFKDFTNTEFWGRMWGRSSADFFSVSHEGIIHYNGADFKLLYEINFKRYGIFNAQIFDDSIILLGIDWSTGANLIIKGVLSK